MVTFESHTQVNVTQVIKISGSLYFIPSVTIMQQRLTMKVERGVALEDLRFLIKKLDSRYQTLLYALIEQGSDCPGHRWADQTQNQKMHKPAR